MSFIDPRRSRSFLAAFSFAAGAGLVLLAACSSSPSNGGGSGFGSGGNSSGSSGSNSGNGGTGSSGNGNSGNSGNGGTGSSGNGGTGSSGNGGTGSSGNGGTGSSGNGGTGSSGNGGTGSSGNGGTGSSGNGAAGTSGVKDAGLDSTVTTRPDGGAVCTNTNTSVINIDSSGVACNNKWGITGAWYCFSDTAGSSTSCPGGPAGVGVIPYNAASGAMCISGTTATQPPGAIAFGAAIGLELNHPNPDAGAKLPFNAKGQTPAILGFAVTISGTSGGANLNINFPPPQMTGGEDPGVAVPGVNGGTSPITYNVLLQDAILSDNKNEIPIPRVLDPANITDIQVKIDVDDTPHAYNFCITKIVPITAAPTAPAAGTAYGPSFTEGKQIVLTGLGPYGVQNDPFNPGNADSLGMQVTYGGGHVGFSATPTFTTGGVGAFPSVAYGWIHGGNFAGGAEPGGYNGGKTITTLTSVTSSWAFTTGSGNWDAAYDCWFGGNPDSINAGSELMIWLNRANVNPIGAPTVPVTVTGSSNGPWGVATGMNMDMPPQQVVSYVTTAGVNSVTGFNLLPFFQDAAKNGRAGISPGSFFLGCQAGFELYNPGTWTTTSYTMTAN